MIEKWDIDFFKNRARNALNVSQYVETKLGHEYNAQVSSLLNNWDSDVRETEGETKPKQFSGHVGRFHGRDACPLTLLESQTCLSFYIFFNAVFFFRDPHDRQKQKSVASPTSPRKGDVRCSVTRRRENSIIKVNLAAASCPGAVKFNHKPPSSIASSVHESSPLRAQLINAKYNFWWVKRKRIPSDDSLYIAGNGLCNMEVVNRALMCH
jgi:hypothetical protein